MAVGLDCKLLVLIDGVRRLGMVDLARHCNMALTIAATVPLTMSWSRWEVLWLKGTLSSSV